MDIVAYTNMALFIGI